MKWFALALLGSAIVFISLYVGITGSDPWDETPVWARTTVEIASNRVVRKRGSRGGEYFEPEVRYSFQVDGQTYYGDRIWLGMGETWPTEESAAAWLNENYPVGRRVEISYDVARPWSSAIILTSNRAVFSLLVFGGFGLALLAAGIVGWRVSRSAGAA